MGAAAITATTAVTFQGVDFVFNPEFIMTIIIVVGIATTMITSLALYRSSREEQEDTDPSTDQEFETEYEKNFARMIEKSGIPFEYSDEIYDFRLHGIDGDYIVEVKTSSKKVSKKNLQEISRRLSNEVNETDAKKKGLIVFLSGAKGRAQEIEFENVQVMGMSDFKKTMKVITPGDRDAA